MGQWQRIEEVERGRRFPLVAGLSNCEFEFEFPADALPTDASAASIYSATARSPASSGCWESICLAGT